MAAQPAVIIPTIGSMMIASAGSPIGRLSFCDILACREHDALTMAPIEHDAAIDAANDHAPGAADLAANAGDQRHCLLHGYQRACCPGDEFLAAVGEELHHGKLINRRRPN